MQWVVMMSTISMMSVTSMMIAPSAGWAQSPQAQAAAATVDLLTSSDLAAQGLAQLAKAKQSENGSVSITLAKYPGHYTMISARTKSGGAEVHAHFSDFLIVVDGEGTELTGGTVVEPKEGADGETRGLRLEGATSHALHKGDVIHIPAGTPHQAIEAPGQTLTLFVIKVATPATEASAAAK
jgi:mannose-6-phosphate isomerase-like protein (cupin superfamily)